MRNMWMQISIAVSVAVLESSCSKGLRSQEAAKAPNSEVETVCAPIQYQAHELESTFGAPYADQGLLIANGFMWVTHDFKAGGPRRISIKARADIADGLGAHMILTVKGATIGETTVSTNGFHEYTFFLNATPGPQDIRVIFDNDHFAGLEDRNLQISQINIDCGTEAPAVPFGDGKTGNLRRVQAFWDASGTNTHFHYRPPYSNPAPSAWADDTKIWNMINFLNPLGPASGMYILREDLLELGFGVDYSGIIERLGQSGYRFIWYPGWKNNDSNGWDDADQGRNLIKFTDKGYTFAIEGPNEVENGFGGIPLNKSSYKAKNGTIYTGAQAPVMWQADLWDTFGPASPYKLPIILFTNGNGGDSKAEVDAAQKLGRPLHTISNRGSVHYYANFGRPVGAGSPPQMEADSHSQTSMTGGIDGHPVAVTEMGFRNLLNDPIKIGRPETNATYIPEMFFDSFKRGFWHVSQYALVDDDSGSGFESSWGIFDTKGNAKPAAVAMRWIAGIMGDTGATSRSFLPGSLNIEVKGLPQDGRWLGFQRSNGDAFIVVWTNDILMTQTGELLTPPSRNIQVDLGRTLSKVDVFDPITGAEKYAGPHYLTAPMAPEPIASYSEVSTVPLLIRGGLQIIRIAR